MTVSPITKGGKVRRRVGPGTPLSERILFHVRKNPRGCWVWSGSISNSGYGRIYLDRRLQYAHRISYAAFVGPIPDGMQIDHLCRNRACVNPNHLEAVTPQVNTRRSMTLGAQAIRRGACKYGHSRAEFGVDGGVRTYCRQCRRDYMRLYWAMTDTERAERKRAGLPVVDLAAYYAEVQLADTA